MRKGTITATIIKSTKSTTSSLGSIFDLSRGMKFQKYGGSETGPTTVDREFWNGMALRGYTCRPMKKTAIGCVLAGCSVMCGFAVFAFGQNHGEKPAGPLLLVANQHDHNLSLIDPAAGKQIATVPVDGVTGHEVAASPDGKTA